MHEHMFVPWEPKVSRSELAEAVQTAHSWRAALDALGYAYHGKNIATVRKWAARWDVSTAHLTDRRGRPNHRVRCSEKEIEAAVASSKSWAETLRRLGYCPTGGNSTTMKKRVAALGISTAHFDPYAAVRERNNRGLVPLEKVLVEGSSYNRQSLKRRLYAAGLKSPRCELCGQGETWQGRKISLIIDHVNGVRDDNRIENLRIVCPNCAAGLDTHCGRKNRIEIESRSCLLCAAEFQPRYPKQLYCSAYCGRRQARDRRRPPPAPTRRVGRPGHSELIREIRTIGYVAVGRMYGVSDNAIRNWIRQYERERAIAEGRDPGVIEIPTKTWPKHKNRLNEAA